MKSYEEKLLAAANELYEKRVFWSPKPKRVAGVPLWLNRTLGWEMPSLFHMTFWQIVIFNGALFAPTKLLFDYTLFGNQDLMKTQGYWVGFALFPVLNCFLLASFFRLIAWRKGLSRWEDL
ncbi:DUF6404 family protein [Maritalea porphyrae]|uniref:DUF6404 family protein n=1 Tax=Maritalea porphyrae TaxID=880732 RepID=UPI0024E10C07|nr:DUF6404 family protein [Maritalea porphyrae]